MNAAEKRRRREERRRRREREREQRHRQKLFSKKEEEKKEVAVVENEAEVGSVSGLVPITLQIPIQIGANAQNIKDSDKVSTTTI